MNLQPSFTTPSEAIQFICEALAQNDPETLYTAFTEQPSEFWKERLFQTLQEIQNTETLEQVFLEDGRITAFPANETALHLGGHNPRTRYLHIKLVKTVHAWMLGSILYMPLTHIFTTISTTMYCSDCFRLNILQHFHFRRATFLVIDG